MGLQNVLASSCALWNTNTAHHPSSQVSMQAVLPALASIDTMSITSGCVLYACLPLEPLPSKPCTHPCFQCVQLREEVPVCRSAILL